MFCLLASTPAEGTSKGVLWSFLDKLCVALDSGGWGVTGECPVSPSEPTVGQFLVSPGLGLVKSSVEEPGDTGVCKEPVLCSCSLSGHASLKLDMFQWHCGQWIP